MIMNPGGGDTSELLATVGFKWLGSGDPGDSPGGAVDPEAAAGKADANRKEADEVKRDKSKKERLEEMAKQGKNHLRNTFGINLGIASILKQSQIFTGTLGTIFQILGALVDVILAPFLPIIVPAIKALAANVPEIQAKAERIIGTLVDGFYWLKDKVGGWMDNKFGKLIKDALQYVIIGLFLARLFNMHRVLFTVVKFILGGITKLVAQGIATMARGLGWKTKEQVTEARDTILLPQIAVNTARMAMTSGLGGGVARTATGAIPLGGKVAGMSKMAMLGRGVAGAGVVGGFGYAGYSIYDSQKEGWGASAGGGALAGTVVGTAIGAALGGPVGAAIGASIGATAGPIIGGWVEKSNAGAAERHKDLYNGREHADKMVFSTPENNPGGWYEEGYDSRGRKIN